MPLTGLVPASMATESCPRFSVPDSWSNSGNLLVYLVLTASGPPVLGDLGMTRLFSRAPAENSSISSSWPTHPEPQETAEVTVLNLRPGQGTIWKRRSLGVSPSSDTFVREGFSLNPGVSDCPEWLPLGCSRQRSTDPLDLFPEGASQFLLLCFPHGQADV